MLRIAALGTSALSALCLLPVAWGGDPQSVAHAPLGGAEDLADAVPANAVGEVNLNVIDQKLALSLAIDMQGQIEMSQFALTAVSNDTLRALIETRVQSQRAFAAELDRLTGGRAASAIARAHREIETDRAAGKDDKSFRLLSLRNASALVARIRLEILREYAQLVRCELGNKSADEFDRHYLRGEVHQQMEMLAALRVFESQASADFAQVIHAAMRVADGHLANTRRLLVELEGAPVVKTAITEAPLAEVVEVLPVKQ